MAFGTPYKQMTLFTILDTPEKKNALNNNFIQIEDRVDILEGQFGGGSVVGPISATDEAVARYNGATGSSLQNSLVTIDDTGNITTPGIITVDSVDLLTVLLNSVRTGLLDGGFIGANVDTTKFDVSDGNGIIVNNYDDPANPTFTQISWTGQTAIIPTFAATALTFIAFNSSGTLLQQATPFTTEQEKDVIVIGVVITANGLNVDSASDQSHSFIHAYDVGDVAHALGSINLSGNQYTAGGANLTLQRSSGSTFSLNINRVASSKDPNVKSTSADAGVVFNYVYDDGTGGFTNILSQVNIDPDRIDDGSGTLATVGNNRWTNQTLYWFPSSENAVVQYGTVEYMNLADAQAAALVTPIPALFGATDGTPSIRTILSVKKLETNLQSSDTAFTNTGKFGIAL